MRIAYLAYTAMPSRKASGVHIMKMCQAFASLGHQVCLFNPRFDKTISSREMASHYGVMNNFSLHSLPLPRHRIKGLLRYHWMYRWMIGRWNPDLLYIRDQGFKVYAPCSLQANKVLEAHLLHRNNVHLSSLASDPGVRKFVAISAVLKDDYAEAYPVLRPKLAVHHDGADSAPTAGIQQQSRIYIRPGKLNAAYIGNLYPGKGMEIISQLLPLADFCHFHIIGGHDSDLELWKARCSGAENISFHGYLSPADVEKIRAGFDCLLAPFQSKVMVGPDTDAARWMSPLKIFEYMAAEVPIIASNLPVIREVLRDGENALLCSPDAPLEWQVALKKLESNPSLGKELAKTAHKELIAMYTWKIRARNILASL